MFSPSVVDSVDNRGRDSDLRVTVQSESCDDVDSVSWLVPSRKWTGSLSSGVTATGVTALFAHIVPSICCSGRANADSGFVSMRSSSSMSLSTVRPLASTNSAPCFWIVVKPLKAALAILSFRACMTPHFGRSCNVRYVVPSMMTNF